MKIDKVAVKVDFTTELVKTIAKGRTVEISAFGYPGSTTVDIEIRVSCMRSILQSSSVRRITARNIYTLGTDQSFCDALGQCNDLLDREVKK